METTEKVGLDCVKAPAKEEKIFAGVCRGNCASGCLLNIHVRDGKVVKTSMREMPNPEYNRICMKGLTHVHRIYSKERLQYPMKRVGERGEGKFERISWDEAITTITGKWKEYQSKYGKTAFSVYSCSGNFGAVNGVGLGNPLSRLINLSGASILNMSLDFAVIFSGMNSLGMGPLFNANEPADLKNAKTIICWGANPVNAQQQSVHFILEAKEKGAKLIVIDPVFSGTAAIADMYVPIRPGTDGALALGMMNIAVRENWMDEPFLKKSTVAPFLVKKADGKYLRQSDLGAVIAAGAIDEPIVWDSAANHHGTASSVADPTLQGSYEINGLKVTTAYDLLLNRIAEYPPEKAAEICNIPVEKIEEITRIYATNKPSSIYQFFGFDHYVNGHYSAFAVHALAMLTGNLAKSGAYCGLGESFGIQFINLAGTLFPPGAAPSLQITQLQLSEVLETNIYGDTPVTLKGVFFTNGNFMGNRIDRKNSIEALKKLDFIAVADIVMSETALYADILLPAAHWFEEDDIVVNYGTHPYVQLQEKAIEPLGESKPDFQIVKLLAEKLGYGEHFAMDEFEYMKLWLDSDGARDLGILERLQKEKSVRCLPGDPYIHGAGGVFPTPTGRAQFYLESPAPDTNYGQQFEISKERLPYFEPPHEVWHENPLHKKYPFALMQEHTKWRTNAQWWEVSLLKELNSEPIVKINSADAASRNIKTGDTVRVFNDRGYVVIKAAINDGVQPGVLTIPKGWEKQEFIEGHYQDLTSRVTNPVCANSAFFDLLVEVEKI